MSLSLGTLILIIKLNQHKVAVVYPLSNFQIIQLAIKLRSQMVVWWDIKSLGPRGGEFYPWHHLFLC
jgi:hypothetical protein